VAVDEHVGDMAGSELIAMVKKVRPEIGAIILTSSSNPRLQEASQATCGAECVEKTASLDQLVSQIASRLVEKEVGFRGLLDNLELPDILQLLCLRGESKEVRITSDAQQGFIVVDGGQIVHARTQSQQGEAAFYDLFGWKGGGFKLKPMASVPKRTIQAPWESLIMEAGRLLDEQAGEAAEAQRPPVVEESQPVENPKPKAPAAATEQPDGLPGVVVVGTKNETGRINVYDLNAAKSKTSKKPEPKPEEQKRPLRVAAAEVKPSPKPAAKEQKKAPARSRAKTRDRKPAKAKPAKAKPTRKPVQAPLFSADRRQQNVRRAPRKGRGKILQKVAAWVVIVTMSVPIVCLLLLVLPWSSDLPQIEARLRSLLPGEMVSTSLAKSTPAAAPVEPLPMPSEWEDDPSVCRVRVAPLAEFSHSGTVVVLAADVYDALGLAGNPWVELTTPAGIRMGAMALRKDDAFREIYIRRTMAWALEIGRDQKVFVKVAPVQLVNKPDEENELVFTATRSLAPAYCKTPYSVGIGLSVMQEANLTPDSYAIAKGPVGYQSVKIQVMDRGNPNEIWLSPNVRKAIGVDAADDRVTLHPRHPLSRAKEESPPAERLVAR